MSLGQDDIEEILIRLPVKSLVRCKLMSRQWRLTIQSQNFKERHLKLQQMRKPDLLLMADQDDYNDLVPNEEIMLRTMVYDNDHHQELLVEQEAVSLQIPYHDVSKSLDGLICIYNFRGSIFMANPTIQWVRQLPQAMIQAFVNGRYDDGEYDYEPNLLGFGKDKSTGIYKLVWLYNVLESDLEGDTTCEVFDFNTNLWRQVESPRYQIFDDQNPIYFNGSLYWLVYDANNAFKILSFDCHTEVFQLISESPITQDDESRVIMCNLNNRLCVSEKTWPRQEIWTLNTSNMTWERIYLLDLSSPSAGLFGDAMWPITSPITILENKKVLFFVENGDNPKLVIYDPVTSTFSLCCDVEYVISAAPFFQTLITLN